MEEFDYSTLISVDTDRLRNNATRVRLLLKAVTPAAIEIGDIIADARDKIPHGMFGSWCVAELGIERRSAQLYMNLARLAATHGREKVEKLPLTAAYRIAARSTPEAVVADLMERVAAGDIPTDTAVKDLIRKQREVRRGPGDDRARHEDVAVLSDLLVNALDTGGLARLTVFLTGASSDAIRELVRNLEVSAPV